MAVSEKSKKNLRPCEYKFTKEDHSNGGRASARKKRERKLFRAQMLEMLKLPLNTSDSKVLETEKAKNLSSFNSNNCDAQTAMLLALIQRALKGDVKAFEAIRDTIGEIPESTLNVKTDNPVMIYGADKIPD